MDGSVRKAKMMLRVMELESQGGKLPEPGSKKWKKAKRAVEEIYREAEENGRE